MQHGCAVKVVIYEARRETKHTDGPDNLKGILLLYMGCFVAVQRIIRNHNVIEIEMKPWVESTFLAKTINHKILGHIHKVNYENMAQ